MINRKSHMCFRLVPNSLTLDDLERPKRPLAEIKKNSGAHQNNFNEDRPILSPAKCRPMGLFSRNVMYCTCGCSWGFHRSEASCRILATYTCVHVLLNRKKAYLRCDVGGFPLPAGLHRRGRLPAAGTPTVLENKAAKLFRAQM